MSSDLQFDHAEFSQASALDCGSCKNPLVGEYFATHHRMLCANCAGQLRQAIDGKGIGIGRFIQSVLLGLGAALLGMAVYAAIMVFAHAELALVSIALGWFVGAAVRRGSHGRGGWRYQLLAAFLTYTAICAAYAISIWFQMGAEQSPELLARLVLSVYEIPFYDGAANIIGILIIGFGVWRAWQMNRPIRLEISGPHAIAESGLQESQPASSPNAAI